MTMALVSWYYSGSGYLSYRFSLLLSVYRPLSSYVSISPIPVQRGCIRWSVFVISHQVERCAQ